MSSPKPPPQDSLVVYDGDCRLCVAAKAGIESLQVSKESCRMTFVPYQSSEAAQALGTEYRPGRPDVAFLVRPDGRIDRGLEAFLPLLPGLRGGRLLLVLLKLPFIRSLAERAYGYIARHRYRLFGQVSRPDV